MPPAVYPVGFARPAPGEVSTEGRREHGKPGGRLKAETIQPSRLLRGVAVYRVRGERREAYGYVLRATRFGTRIANPLTPLRHDGLPCSHIERAALVLHAKESMEHERDLLKLGSLAGFFPPLRRHHPSDADARMSGIDPPGVLLDLLGLVTCGFDDGRSANECGHEV